MKDEMRKYFPERFEDSPMNTRTSWNTFTGLLGSSKNVYIRRKCEETIKGIFERSIEVKLLAGALKKHGCNFDLSRHIVCEQCTADCFGGYDPDTQQIVMCENQDSRAEGLASTLIHEMIHMLDFCRVKFDFNNLDHIGCSEMRAANLTNCSLADKFKYGSARFYNFKKAHQSCVKDVTFQSIKAYSPDTDDEKINEIVERIFPYCYNDLEPFGRRLYNGNRDIKQSYRERYHFGYIY